MAQPIALNDRFGRIGRSTSVCERSTGVGAAGRQRPHIRPVTGCTVNGERWVPFTVQSNPALRILLLSPSADTFAEPASPGRHVSVESVDWAPRPHTSHRRHTPDNGRQGLDETTCCMRRQVAATFGIPVPRGDSGTRRKREADDSGRSGRLDSKRKTGAAAQPALGSVSGRHGTRLQSRRLVQAVDARAGARAVCGDLAARLVGASPNSITFELLDEKKRVRERVGVDAGA
eukprot:365215-Chlamydomonas_euryale.AAC.3